MSKKRKISHNKSLSVVEQSARYVVFYTPFPGLYLTYDQDGKLMETETETQRKLSGRTMVRIEGCLVIGGGELGSEDYQSVRDRDIPVDDDDCPF